MESELLAELSTEEQQLLSGGQFLTSLGGGQLNLPARLRGRLRDREGNRYRVRVSISEPIEEGTVRPGSGF